MHYKAMLGNTKWFGYNFPSALIAIWVLLKSILLDTSRILSAYDDQTSSKKGVQYR